jgi:hypothetical protein
MRKNYQAFLKGQRTSLSQTKINRLKELGFVFSIRTPAPRGSKKIRQEEQRENAAGEEDDSSESDDSDESSEEERERPRKVARRGSHSIQNAAPEKTTASNNRWSFVPAYPTLAPQNHAWDRYDTSRFL